MSTYSELTAEVLGMLDQPLDTTGDVLTNVQTKLHRLNLNLCAKLRPDTLLEEAVETGVTSSATSIGLTSGTFNFGVVAATFDKNYSLSVDESGDSTRNDLGWEFVEWKAWKRQNTKTDGNTRVGYDFWTYDARDGLFYLSRWPSGSITWDVYLNYFELPAAYNDSSTPEIPVIHHGTLSYGCVLEFPQFFKGERQMLFAYYQEMFAKSEKALLADQMIYGKKFAHGIALGQRKSFSNMWGSN